LKRNAMVALLLLAVQFLLPVLLIRGEPLSGDGGQDVGLLPMQQAGQSGELDSGERVRLLGQDGEVTESVTSYEDGQATFTIGADDKLTWTDAKENAGEDMAFERDQTVGFAPDAEDFSISYFRMLGDPELSLDKKACEAMNFAATSELWRADVEAMRDNMFKAWEGLTEEEQAAFDGSFMDVVKLLDACFEDWDTNRATFTDGRDGRMDELLAEPLYRDAWNTLKGNTLTLGNSEG